MRLTYTLEKDKSCISWSIMRKEYLLSHLLQSLFSILVIIKVKNLKLMSIGCFSISDLPHRLHPISYKPIIDEDYSNMVVCEQEDEGDEQEEDGSSLERLWLIVRYMEVDSKSNQFHLKGGETLKLGRVKFIVKEVNLTSDEDNLTEVGSND